VKTHKLTIEIEMSSENIRRLRENSILRVMNNAIFVGEKGEQKFQSDDLRERASTLWQDCEELKLIVNDLWRSAQNAAFPVVL